MFQIPCGSDAFSASPMRPLLVPSVPQLRLFFKHCLEPILTPLAVDPGHPFPFIGNMTLAIAVVRGGGREGIIGLVSDWMSE